MRQEQFFSTELMFECANTSQPYARKTCHHKSHTTSFMIWQHFRHRKTEKNSACKVITAHLGAKQELSDHGSIVVRKSAPKQMLLLGESSRLLACVLICSWQKLIPGAFPGQWEYLPRPDNHYGLPLT